MPEVRPYAAAELNRRAGRDFWDNPLPGLEPIHCDSAVMASHGIIAAYEGSKDPAEVARAAREEASWTSEAAMFGEMWRSRHQVAYQALAVIGQHHPDKKTAKAARAALHKASSARLPTAPHGPLQPSARSGRAPPAREKRSPGPRGAWPASRQPSAAAARRRTSGQPAPSHRLPAAPSARPGNEPTATFAQRVLDHERADQLANPPKCGKCGSPVDRVRNRRGCDDYRLHWVCGSQMPNLLSPGSGEAPGQRQ